MLSDTFKQVKEALDVLEIRAPADTVSDSAPFQTITITAGQARRIRRAMAELRRTMEEVKKWEMITK